MEYLRDFRIDRYNAKFLMQSNFLETESLGPKASLFYLNFLAFKRYHEMKTWRRERGRGRGGGEAIPSGTASDGGAREGSETSEGSSVKLVTSKVQMQVCGCEFPRIVQGSRMRD